MTEVSTKKVIEKGTVSFSCVDELHHIHVLCSGRYKESFSFNTRISPNC